MATLRPVMSPQVTFIVAASADRGVTANASVSTPTNTSDAHRAERIVERAPRRDHTFKPMVTPVFATRAPARPAGPVRMYANRRPTT
jgi:hypothetical protein